MRSSADRLSELRQLLLLDSAPERSFDDITQLLASSLSVPIAMVNLLDEQRDWFKSRVGLAICESPAETSFCEVFFGAADDIVIVNDTLLDSRFSNHPFVLGDPHIRFYAAARLTSNGQTVGTLCAYDLVPKTLSNEQMAQLQTLAAAAMHLLVARNDKSPAPANAGPAN
jgi:GAF domain-containing protein